MLSSLLSVAYLLPIVGRAFFRPAADGENVGVREAPWLCVVPRCLTAIGSLVLFFAAPRVHALLLPLVAP